MFASRRGGKDDGSVTSQMGAGMPPWPGLGLALRQVTGSPVWDGPHVFLDPTQAPSGPADRR
jgi:hypothetical protein